MLKIAITGGIASGKSFILKYISKLGYQVISADEEIAKIYTEPAILLEISKLFGILVKNKSDVKTIILKDITKLPILERILYKKLYRNFAEYTRKFRIKGYKACFFEIPLLFEKGTAAQYDKIINIETPIFIQKRRFLSRKSGQEKEFYRFRNLQLHSAKKKYLTKQKKGLTILNFSNKNLLKTTVKNNLQKILDK